jgi:hypothetical protein
MMLYGSIKTASRVLRIADLEIRFDPSVEQVSPRKPTTNSPSTFVGIFSTSGRSQRVLRRRGSNESNIRTEQEGSEKARIEALA